MSLILEQKQKAGLALTKGMLEYFKMLKLNNIELAGYIKSEYLENPLIEINEKEDEVENDFEKYEYNHDDEKRISKRNRGEINFENFANYDPKTIRNELISNIPFELDDEEKYIFEFLSYEIDENGYLSDEVKDLSSVINVSDEKIEDILKILQKCSIPGVGARDVKECLLLQLERYKEVPELKGLDEKKVEKLKKFVSLDFIDIKENKLKHASEVLNLPLKEVEELLEIIKHINPHPANCFEGFEQVHYIIPDIEVYFNGDNEIEIIFNDDYVPEVSINQELFEGSQNSKDVYQYLSEAKSFAKLLISNIYKRKETIKKITKVVFEMQENFLREGEKALVPLTYKDVAEKIEMSSSTISRAMEDKYVKTPRGIYEMKYFFDVSGRNEFFHSSKALKEYIKQIIDDEDKSKPLSDMEITRLLSLKGMNIARRTVYKYRESIGIPSSQKRKKSKNLA